MECEGFVKENVNEHQKSIQHLEGNNIGMKYDRVYDLIGK